MVMPYVACVVLGVFLGAAIFFTMRSPTIEQTYKQYEEETSAPIECPPPKKKKDEKQGQRKSGGCSICQETSGEVRLIRLICSHVFHEKCYNSLIRYSTQCPNCRKTMIIKENMTIEQTYQ